MFITTCLPPAIDEANAFLYFLSFLSFYSYQPRDNKAEISLCSRFFLPPDKHDTFNEACMLKGKGTQRANLFKWIRALGRGKKKNKVPTVPTTDTFIIVVPFSQIINFILSTWACVWCSLFSACSLPIALRSIWTARFLFSAPLLCLLLVLKFIISHAPCLCRILSPDETRFPFSNLSFFFVLAG